MTLGNHTTVIVPVKQLRSCHDDVIKWKHFPRYWPFVRGIHRSPVNSPHKGQWRGALMFTLICARINGWVNNREAGDLRRHRAHSDVIVMGNGQHGFTKTDDVIKTKQSTTKPRAYFRWHVVEIIATVSSRMYLPNVYFTVRMYAYFTVRI